MRTIDLSCDLGEAADEAQQRIEDSIWPLITSANVACGAHAGDDRTMRHATEQARRHRVRLGAHPSYPDREHFGRRTMQVASAILRDSLIEQIATLSLIAGPLTPLTHVKPHGALYNDAHHDISLARIVAEAIVHSGQKLALVCSVESALYRAADEAGLPTIGEAFADRRYERDGSLVPRSRPDALLLDVNEAAEQAVSLARTGEVVTARGEKIVVRFDTLCIHGDMPNSVGRLQAIRALLSRHGFTLAARATSA